MSQQEISQVIRSAKADEDYDPFKDPKEVQRSSMEICILVLNLSLALYIMHIIYYFIHILHHTYYILQRSTSLSPALYYILHYTC
jgi:hypothetical protein